MSILNQLEESVLIVIVAAISRPNRDCPVVSGGGNYLGTPSYHPNFLPLAKDSRLCMGDTQRAVIGKVLDHLAVWPARRWDKK